MSKKKSPKLSLAELCEAAGLSLRICADFHWRVEGGEYGVNYYPSKQKAYVNGTTAGFRIRSDEDLIDIAMFGPRHAWLPAGERNSPQMTKHRRKTLWNRGQKACKWCKCELTLEKRDRELGAPFTATLDHVVPISRGGMDTGDNVVLACEDCNKLRGNRIGPPRETSK